MKRYAATALLLLCLHVSSFAQRPELHPFKNDPALSDPAGFVLDTTGQQLMYKMQEPLLSNYYLNKDIYRFTLAPSLMRSTFVIQVTKTKDSILITTKDLMDETEEERPFGIFSRRKYVLVINSTRSLSDKGYNALMQLMDTFYTHSFTPDPVGNDGSDWMVEVSTKDGYMYQKKWSPRKGDPIKDIGDLMIDLSDLKHKKSVRKF